MWVFRLARTDRNLAQRIYDWICDTISKIGKNADARALINARRMYEKALRTVGDTQGEARYSISKSLGSELQSVLDGTFQSKNNEVYVGTTSNFLVNRIGANELPVTMPPSKAYSAMVTKEQAKADNKYDKDTNYHGLGKDGLVRALVASENPVAAFAGAPDESGKRASNIVLVTDEMGTDGPIVVVETFDTTGYVDGKRAKANKVITSYDRGAITRDIEAAAVDGRLLYLDKKRSQTLLAGVPASNSQGAIREVDFEKNIQEFWQNVKWEKSNKGSYAADSKLQEIPEWKKKLQSFDAQASYGSSFEERVERAGGKVPEKSQQQKAAEKKQRVTIAKRDLRRDLLGLFSVPEGQRSAMGSIIDSIAEESLKNGINNAPAVIYNPTRNALIYLTENQDSYGNYIIAAFDLNNDLYGEAAHRATSIHGRENLAALLKNLGEDATVFVKNENKLNQMLPGNQILKSLELLAKVELDGGSISNEDPDVKASYGSSHAERAERLATQTQVNGKADGETNPLHNANPKSETQIPMDKFLYTEALMRKAEREGNIYTQRLLQKEIEEAQRKIRKAKSEANGSMPTIYADFLKQRAGIIGQEDSGAELLTPAYIESYTEKEKQFEVLYGEEASKVDFRYINSNLHREKFDQITTSQKTNKSIYDICKTILRRCDGTEYEELFLLNMDGETIAKVTERSLKLGIVYSENFRKTLVDIAKNNIPVIAIHNHPHGTPPSPDDFRKAFENNYSIGVVVGHNGQVYIYSNTTVKLTHEQTDQMADDIEMLYRLGWDIDRASRLIYDNYGLSYSIVERGD